MYIGPQNITLISLKGLLVILTLYATGYGAPPQSHTSTIDSHDKEPQADPWLTTFFEVAQSIPNRSAQRAIKKVLKDPQTYRFQLLITEYKRSKDGVIQLTPHAFRVDAEYFYPASAIKTFGSIAALREYTLLRQTHPWLTTNDPMSQRSKTCEKGDSSNLKEGHATLEHEIKKTQLISSNKAFNTVFNVTGFRRLHEHISHDFPSVRVFHRLSSRETHIESLKTPSLKICDIRKQGVQFKRRFVRDTFTSSSDISDLTTQHPKGNHTGFGENRQSLKVGRAFKHMKSRERIPEPMDFSRKNRASFYDFQRLNMAMYMPDLKTPIGPPVKILSDQGEAPPIRRVWLKELRHAMAIYPRHSNNPKYSGRSLSEARFKPMITGVRSASNALSDQRLYYLNKAGKALGFHMDNAFIAYGPQAGDIKGDGFPQKRPQRGVFVTVGVYVNKDGVLNDDQYEYKTISAPLLNAIGYAVGRYLVGKWPVTPTP